ncbi:M-phase inducer phosphatase 3 [Vombatus ursinus]|uniref:M-phase inducer phosphatase n=1 Tax=Vombatus ursinus TaxID=29139 RepID=A0A4X2KRZ3_VOMUR|nr:M-phase inducer phosphatase 3 [Vombatus ursinus]XP_027712339.1 M-phase inducer phosphatase 3 [Vombatus ursinus]XP_027712340.1 M-phase inducer phosphatase 3 [Vombatus ursinus]
MSGTPFRSCFRSNCREKLNLLLEKDASFSFCSELPKTPSSKFLVDSGNLSSLTGATPKRCLDLSNSSIEETAAIQLATSPDLDETGNLASLGPQEVHLAEMDHPQHIRKCIPAQMLCSTPSALGFFCQKTSTTGSYSSDKENESSFLEHPTRPTLGSFRLGERSKRPLLSPLLRVDNGNSVEGEMNDLGSPITRILLHQDGQEGCAGETSLELMEVFLEEQEAKESDLKKTVSLCDVNALQILGENSDQRQLIGDFTKVCVLPTVTGKHQDLKYINPESVAALLWGQLQDLIEKFYVIDCRYPYEYQGGHIQGALNLHSQEELHNFFLKKPFIPSSAQKRVVIVFHCEFSSERGPRMCRYLREEDRALNKYPALYYPELYILKGGYRDFFLEYVELCEPQSYCPMHHQDYKAELLKCQSQSKAWTEERQLRGQIACLVKDGNSG